MGRKFGEWFVAKWLAGRKVLASILGPAPCWKGKEGFSGYEHEVKAFRTILHFQFELIQYAPKTPKIYSTTTTKTLKDLITFNSE